MGGIANVIAALHAMGVELKAVAEDAAKASEEVEKYASVEAARSTTSSMTKAGGDGATGTKQLAAALKAVR